MIFWANNSCFKRFLLRDFIFCNCEALPFLYIFVLQFLKPPLDNACAMLRVLVVLDCKPTRLSEQGIIALSKYLSGYLIEVVHVSASSLFHIYPQLACLIRNYFSCCLFRCLNVGSWEPLVIIILKLLVLVRRAFGTKLCTGMSNLKHHTSTK